MSRLLIVLCLLLVTTVAQARIKLVALPERGHTTVRLDNPAATLIEEERVLTLQKGTNLIDFAWNGVSVDAISIRLAIISNDHVNLLNVSYPPNEEALVWEVASAEAGEVKVRISYLLKDIDRLVTYRMLTDKAEKQVSLNSYLILRNFSGEDFEKADIMLNYGKTFEQGISNNETKQLLFFSKANIPITKVWKFDTAVQPWDPDKLTGNVGIPVYYRLENSTANGLGQWTLWEGRVRVYQEDGHGSTIFLGEDDTKTVPPGEKMEIYVGDSRDIVVTQRKMLDTRINIQRNTNNVVVLFDTDEEIVAKIQNFKDQPAVLTLIEHIPGQWDMEKCNLKYTRKDNHTLEFEIALPPQGKQELTMKYHQRNLRPTVH